MSRAGPAGALTRCWVLRRGGGDKNSLKNSAFWFRSFPDTSFSPAEGVCLWSASTSLALGHRCRATRGLGKKWVVEGVEGNPERSLTCFGHPYGVFHYYYYHHHHFVRWSGIIHFPWCAKFQVSCALVLQCLRNEVNASSFVSLWV